MDISYLILKYIFKLFGTSKFFNFNLPNKRNVNYSDILDIERGNETSYVFKDQANLFFEWFDGKFNVEDLRNKLVLDLGSGFGGRTIYYAHEGNCQLCIGLDADKQGIKEGMKYADYIEQPNVKFIIGIGEKLPFKSNSFDYVISYDVLEHVNDFEAVCEESYRILKKGGLFFSIFPPYYSATGSHIKRTNIPWMNVFFSTAKTYEVLRKEFGDKYYLWYHKGKILRKGLNGITVKDFEDYYLKKSNFKLKYLNYAPLFSKPTTLYRKIKIKEIREIIRIFFLLLGRIHYLREYFTHRIVLIFENHIDR